MYPRQIGQIRRPTELPRNCNDLVFLFEYFLVCKDSAMALLAKASDLGQNASRSSQSFQQKSNCICGFHKKWFPILFEAWQNIKHFPIVTCQKLQEHVRTVADLYFTRSSQASLSFKAMAGCKICPWIFFSGEPRLPWLDLPRCPMIPWRLRAENFHDVLFGSHRNLRTKERNFWRWIVYFPAWALVSGAHEPETAAGMMQDLIFLHHTRWILVVFGRLK